MNIKTLKILIIPFLLAVMLGGTYLMPRRGKYRTPPSAWISPQA